MHVKTKFLPEKKVIGLKGRFISSADDFDNSQIIPKLWSEYLGRREELVTRISAQDIGVNIPMTQDRAKFHPDERLYMAGAEVSNLSDLPKGMTALTIPPGRYAVFVHKGRPENLGQTLDSIFEDWLPRAGKKVRDAPVLEVYGSRFRSGSDESEFEVYVPIE